MKKHPNDASNQEVIQTLGGAIEKLDKRVMGVEASNRDILGAIQMFAGNVDNRFDSIERRVTKIEATMVTKDYLDDKLANIHSDIIAQTRKECGARLKAAGLSV